MGEIVVMLMQYIISYIYIYKKIGFKITFFIKERILGLEITNFVS